MYAFESAKSRFENLTGWAQPRPGEIKKRIKKAKPRATVFKDSNLIPNNPTLPFLHYRKVASLTGLADPAALFERLFKTNGWMDAWRNGVYDYVTTRERMKCLASHEDTRGYVSAAKKGEQLMSGQAMS